MTEQHRLCQKLVEAHETGQMTPELFLEALRFRKGPASKKASELLELYIRVFNGVQEPLLDQLNATYGDECLVSEGGSRSGRTKGVLVFTTYPVGEVPPMFSPRVDEIIPNPFGVGN